MWRQWLITDRPTLPARALRVFLQIASLPYAIVTSLRNYAYDRGWRHSQAVDIPVLCVGNLSVGGTGKTPMVAWLCQWLRGRGLRVAIVSRGYGQLASGSNDEALELEMRLPDVPHLQNVDRVAAAQLAQDELDMQVIVLDDGFQHRRLRRSLDIVLIDASEPSAADGLIPSGLMRESWRGLKRAGVVVLTRSDLARADRLEQLERRVHRVAPQALCIRSRVALDALIGLNAPFSQIEQLAGKRVLAFCGIGNPDGFYRALEKQSIQLIDRRSLPDHHAYRREDVEQLAQWAEEYADCAAIVCTMKDWVKLQVARLGPLPLVAVHIEVKMDAEDEFALASKLNEVLTQSSSGNHVQHA